MSLGLEELSNSLSVSENFHLRLFFELQIGSYFPEIFYNIEGDEKS